MLGHLIHRKAVPLLLEEKAFIPQLTTKKDLFLMNRSFLSLLQFADSQAPRYYFAYSMALVSRSR